MSSAQAKSRQDAKKKAFRIHVICEGQTEEMFVNLVLQPHFQPLGIHVIPKLIGIYGHRGGNVGYRRVITDIKFLLENDPHSYVTTFIDYYGIYANFPGVPEAKKKRTALEKHDEVVGAFYAKLVDDLGTEAAERVVPYVQMHEFEGLLFSDPQEMANGILQPHLWKKFAKILFEFESPEEINDNIETAPSKRIEHIFRGYQKVLHGSVIVRRIGLEKIRRECFLFDMWLAQLENLSAT
ncbi:MAG: DUF4276 family protein [Planctomycetaceae bacterium]|nr:DUF4276 family protein [Planctomycetaceae bacterium]